MTRDLTLAECFWLAEQVTGVDADTLAEASRSELAESALHAPRAGFGDVEFYPGDIADALRDASEAHKALQRTLMGLEGKLRRGA